MGGVGSVGAWVKFWPGWCRSMKYWRGSLVLGVGLNILLFNHTALLALQLFFVILKDAIMQIEKALINDCLHVSKVS